MLWSDPNAIEDEEEREKFFSMETTFSLPAEQVDLLRSIGGVLLEKSRCFKVLTGATNDNDNTCVY